MVSGVLELTGMAGFLEGDIDIALLFDIFTGATASRIQENVILIRKIFEKSVIRRCKLSRYLPKSNPKRYR